MIRFTAYPLSMIVLALLTAVADQIPAHADAPRVYAQGRRPNDARLQDLKDLNDYFPFEVPESAEAWQTRAEQLRRRVLVATGLWPMPAKTALNPKTHGKVQRDGFTVEKVHFESIPGHFVTGLLFRPDDGQTDVRRPAVLSPHGHGGRLQDYGERQIRQLIADGAERFEKSGRFPKLARCAQLARIGCVTFIFDMLGYADSVQISRDLAHGFSKQRPAFEGVGSWGLFSTQAELRLQSVMGIQTWNSVRALDFLAQLPDVDPDRMAVTGGSGGGTQTILLCAIDSRPVAAFPNGMVSTSMQGGCTCENCCLLRVGTGNVELAALFAPKPQAMTAADDWTREMMTKGYPQLRQLYAMLGAKEDVYCRPLLHFPHNYNYVSRATMYSWFNKHLGLGLDEPVVEEDYRLLTPEEYTVWPPDEQPAGGEAYERSLTAYLAGQSDQQIASLIPEDQNELAQFRRVLGGAFETIIGRGMPKADQIRRAEVEKLQRDGYIQFKDVVRLESQGEELPVISLYPTDTEWNGDVVLWIHGEGKQSLFSSSNELHRAAGQLLSQGAAVVSADLYQQGEFLVDGQPVEQQRVVDNPREAAAYTYGYNHTLLARRVHDILTLLAWVRSDQEYSARRVHVLGVAGAGPWVAAASAVAGDAVDRVVVDTEGFRFTRLTSYRDPNFLPGAVKYLDVPGLLSLSAPRPLLIAGEQQLPHVVSRTYTAAGQAKHVQLAAGRATMDAAIVWLSPRD